MFSFTSEMRHFRRISLSNSFKSHQITSEKLFSVPVLGVGRLINIYRKMVGRERRGGEREIEGGKEGEREREEKVKKLKKGERKSEKVT